VLGAGDDHVIEKLHTKLLDLPEISDDLPTISRLSSRRSGIRGSMLNLCGQSGSGAGAEVGDWPDPFCRPRGANSSAPSGREIRE